MPVRLPARRLPVAAAAAVLLMVPFAGVASAHVEAESEGATRGGSGTVTFTVPTEKDVPTTKVEVAFPLDTPLVGVTPQPMDGWTAALTTAPPAGPVTGPDGQPVTELVTRVTWTATAGGVPPEKSGEFAVSVGRFPDVGSVEFKALQTYGDGSVVSWIEEQPEGAPEPEHPAPVLDLGGGGAAMSAEPDGSSVAPSVEAAAPTAASEPAPEPPPSGGAGNTVSAVVVGLIAVGLAAGAATAGRRRSPR